MKGQLNKGKVSKGKDGQTDRQTENRQLYDHFRQCKEKG